MHAQRQNRHCTTGGAITSKGCKTFSRQLRRLPPLRAKRSAAAKRGPQCARRGTQPRRQDTAQRGACIRMDHAGESWPNVSGGAKRARPHAGHEPTKASGRAACKSCLIGAMQCSTAVMLWERPAGRRESGRMLYNVFMLRAAGRARGRGRLCPVGATGRRTGRGHAT